MLEEKKLPANDLESAKKTVEENRLAQVKPLNRKKNDLIDELKDLNTFLERTSARLFKFLGIYEKGWLAIILPNLILLLVATVEMPMNMTAFESLEMGQNETVIIAILFGLTIATMAHFTGYFFKRYVVTKQQSHVIIAMFILTMTTIGLYVSAELRGRYLATMHEDVIVPQFVWFFMSLFIFSAGVVSSYKFASSAKNEKEEKTYFQKLREFNRKKRQLSRLNDTIVSVNKKSANEIKQLLLDKAKEEKAEQERQKKADSEKKRSDQANAQKLKEEKEKAEQAKTKKVKVEDVDEEEEPLSEESKLELEDEVGKITNKWNNQKADASETEQETPETEVKKEETKN